MNNQFKHNRINEKEKSEYGFEDFTQKYLNRLLSAIINREKIVLFGYHDMDGVLSISTLLLVLRYLNADVEYFMPREVDSTRELKYKYVEEYIQALGTDLIITIGCGIDPNDEERLLKNCGIDILVLDNTINISMEGINAILHNDSKIEELNTYIMLFKLIQAINDNFSTKVFNKYIDLIMLGIVSKYENLDYKSEKLLLNGLKIIRKTNNYGILALFKLQNIDELTLESITEVFKKLKPSINPLGKMDNSKVMVELFTTSDKERATQVAKYVCKECEQIY